MRRLLAISEPPAVRLTPIYVAFCLIALLSVLELVVASWPRAPAPVATARPVERAAEPPNPAFEGSLRVPAEPSAPRRRTHWM